MRSVLLRFGLVPTLCCLAFAHPALAGDCYVIGDTAGNNPAKPLGSKQNPFGSLAAVQADASCEVITVLYSGTELDGGIILRDGQRVIGQKGPAGALPVITNSASPYGYGVVLARDTQLQTLHIKDTQGSGIVGDEQIQPFGGLLQVQNVRVTGANQSGKSFEPPFFVMPLPSVQLRATSDTTIEIKNSDIGEANVPSIVMYQLDGYGTIRISNTKVHDQGQLSESCEVSPGIAVLAQDSASVDVTVLNTTVHNIGSAFCSNSDGLALLNQGSGTMNVKVDGYHYSNPDGGGRFGTSTGIEMGFFLSTGGGTFNGVVANSVIEDAFFTGVQVLDQLSGDGNSSGGGNTLTAEIRDNNISGTWGGIHAFVDRSPFSSMFVDVSGNTIATADRLGCGCSVGIEAVVGNGSTNVFEARLEANTVINTVGIGLLFASLGSVNSVHMDAGLGVLGSAGQNRIVGTVVVPEGADILADHVAVSAASNWWGSASGPTTVVEVNGGTVDVEPFLTTDPN